MSIKSQPTLFFIILPHKFSYRQINCFITSWWCIYITNRALTLYIPVLVFFALFFIIPLQRLIISMEMSSQFCALPPTSADAHCFTSPAVSFTLCLRAWFPPNYHYTSGHATTMQMAFYLHGGILRWRLLQLVASVVLELWLSQRQQFVICKYLCMCCLFFYYFHSSNPEHCMNPMVYYEWFILTRKLLPVWTMRTLHACLFGCCFL